MAVQTLREQRIEWDGRPKGMEEVVDQTVLAHRREIGSHDTHHKRT
jgi:hypothetical protein